MGTNSGHERSGQKGSFIKLIPDVNEIKGLQDEIALLQ